MEFHESIRPKDFAVIGKANFIMVAGSPAGLVGYAFACTCPREEGPLAPGGWHGWEDQPGRGRIYGSAEDPGIGGSGIRRKREDSDLPVWVGKIIPRPIISGYGCVISATTLQHIG